MTPDQEQEILNKALLFYGTENQEWKAIEEFGELLAAHARDEQGLPSNLSEEWADFRIVKDQLKEWDSSHFRIFLMTKAMELLHKHDNSQIDATEREWRIKKLRRLQERISQ